MTKYTFVFMMALQLFSSVAMAEQPVAEIDQEVVHLLSLNEEQAVSYSTIMQRQRAVYQVLQPQGWAQQMAFYEQTFDRLKPVLTEVQHIRFVAYMNSFMEATPEQDLVAME